MASYNRVEHHEIHIHLNCHRKQCMFTFAARGSNFHVNSGLFLAACELSTSIDCIQLLSCARMSRILLLQVLSYTRYTTHHIDASSYTKWVCVAQSRMRSRGVSVGYSTYSQDTYTEIYYFDMSRQAEQSPVFGAPCALPLSLLPTYGDVVRAFLFQRHNLNCSTTSSTRTVPTAIIASSVADDIIRLWARASIPTVTKKRVNDMIIAYHKKHRNILQSSKRKNSQCQSQLSKFRTHGNATLFDIASCKCEFACSCVIENKIPKEEVTFLQDQRSVRQMMIGECSAFYN